MNLSYGQRATTHSPLPICLSVLNPWALRWGSFWVALAFNKILILAM